MFIFEVCEMCAWNECFLKKKKYSIIDIVIRVVQQLESWTSQ